MSKQIGTERTAFATTDGTSGSRSSITSPNRTRSMLRMGVPLHQSPFVRFNLISSRRDTFFSLLRNCSSVQGCSCSIRHVSVCGTGHSSFLFSLGSLCFYPADTDINRLHHCEPAPKMRQQPERQASQYQSIPFFPPALHQRQSITHQIPAAMFWKQHLQDGCSQTNRQQPQPASQK